MTPVEILFTWVAAILTLMVFSFLWRENKFYRIAEFVGVGAAAGHAVLISISSINTSGIRPVQSGEWTYIIPLILGFIVFLRFSRRYGWLSRYPIMITLGVGIGIMLGTVIESQLIALLKATIQNIFVKDVFLALGGLIILIGLVTTLSYFIFTKEQKGILGVSGKIGRVFMMTAFGCTWAGELVYYLGLIVGAFIFLIEVWIKQTILGGII